MRLSKLLLLNILLIICYGCNREKEYKTFRFSTKENYSELDKISKGKIVVFINGSCSCATEKILFYQDFFERLGPCNQNLILCFIITSSDNYTLFDQLIYNYKIKFSYPPLYDNLYVILRQNKININDENSQTLLLNKRNEIIAKGDIRFNNGLEKKYLQLIKKNLPF